MKKVITAIVAFVVVALMAFGYMEAVKHREHTGDKKFDPKETIFEHLGDAYGWELPFNHSVRIPLPIIVLDQQNGIHCFMSSEVTDGGTCQASTSPTKATMQAKWWVLMRTAKNIGHLIFQSPRMPLASLSRLCSWY